MTNVEDVLSTLARLDGDYRFLSSLVSPPPEPAIAAAEAALGLRFAADYRALLARFGSIYVEVVESVWPRLKPIDDRPAWQMSYGRMVHGVGAGLHEDLDVVVQTRKFGRWTGLAFVPVVRTVAGGGVVHGFDAHGRFATWDRHTGVQAAQRELFDTILAEVAALVVNRERLRGEPVQASLQGPPRFVVSLGTMANDEALHAALAAAVEEVGQQAPSVLSRVDIFVDDPYREDAGDEPRDRPTSVPGTLRDLLRTSDATLALAVGDADFTVKVVDRESGGGRDVAVEVPRDPRADALCAFVLDAVSRAVGGTGPIVERKASWE
jgi:hypothetical protein